MKHAIFPSRTATPIGAFSSGRTVAAAVAAPRPHPRPHPLWPHALLWFAVVVCLAYCGLWSRAAWALGPFLAAPALLAWSLLWSRNRRLLDRQGARLFTALLSGTALSWVVALAAAYAPQHAPALHLALVVVLWDWFGRRIRTPGKRLLLHSAAAWAGAAAWTSHEAPPDDVATEVVLGAVAGVVTLWLLPLARRVESLRAWRRGLVWTAGARAGFHADPGHFVINR